MATWLVANCKLNVRTVCHAVVGEAAAAKEAHIGLEQLGLLHVGGVVTVITSVATW